MCGHCFTVYYVCFIVCCNPAFLAAKSNKGYYYYYHHNSQQNNKLCPCPKTILVSVSQYQMHHRTHHLLSL